MSRLKTTPVRSPEDIRAFFDRAAPSFTEQHGDAEKLLKYRIGLVRSAAAIKPGDVVLDIGCGTGHHLMALAEDFGRGIGVDSSPAMIQVSNQRLKRSDPKPNISFDVDEGERLRTVQDESVDLAMCIGSLEHMVDQLAVVKSAYRVLRPNGRFLCLTPNRDYIWYRLIAPALGVYTRHLSTDRFFIQKEIEALLKKAGFVDMVTDHWTFIPKGDMHFLLGLALQMTDYLGRILRVMGLRGGLISLGLKSSGQ